MNVQHVLKWLVILICLMCIGGSLADAESKLADSESKTAQKIASTKAIDLELKDWLIAGSGCVPRRLSDPGEVKVVMTQSRNEPDCYEFSINLEKYELDGANPIRKQNATFARECAIRLALYPTSNKKITYVDSGLSLAMQRSKDVKVQIRSQLLLGPDVLEDWQKEFLPNQGKTEFTQFLELKPSEKSIAHFEKVECAQPRLVGLNLSFVNYRETFDQKIKMGLVDNKVKFTIKLDDCASASGEKTSNGGKTKKNKKKGDA